MKKSFILLVLLEINGKSKSFLQNYLGHFRENLKEELRMYSKKR